MTFYRTRYSALYEKTHDKYTEQGIQAFLSLRRSMGTDIFDEFVEEKIYPIFGDLTEANIGLSEADLDVLCSQINVIFHCAGNVDGNEGIENAVRVSLEVRIISKFHSNDAFFFFADQYARHQETV